MKPKNRYMPELSSPSAFNSEYKKMFDPKEHDNCSYKKQMSVRELQDFVTRK